METPTEQRDDTRWCVPCLWPGETVACLAGGPSLTPDDVEYCQRWHTIAINDAYRLAPWADVLYGCDGAWWTWHEGVPGFPGVKVSGTRNGAKWPGVKRVDLVGEPGLSLEPGVLSHGRNGGYQAINLAVQLGAARIVLLGYDMRADPATGKHHWFGDHPSGIAPPYDAFLREYPSLVEPLRLAGVEVVNCTPSSALTCFECADLRALR